MTVLPVGYGEASIYWLRTGDPEPYINVVGFSNVAAYSVTEAANAVATVWGDTWTASQISQQMRLDKVVVALQGEEADPDRTEKLIGHDGTFNEQLVPQNTAALIHKVTSRGGRKGKGRLYHPFLAEGQINNIGAIDTSTRDGLTNKYEAIRTEMANADIPMVLLHTEPKVGIRPNPDVVTAVICDAIVATQRRRLRH